MKQRTPLMPYPPQPDEMAYLVAYTIQHYEVVHAASPEQALNRFWNQSHDCTDACGEAGVPFVEDPQPIGTCPACRKPTVICSCVPTPDPQQVGR